MPLDQLPVPDITLQDSDKATTFKTKMNTLSVAMKTAIQAFNTQIAAGNLAENSAVVAGQHKDAADLSATTAGQHKDTTASLVVTAGQHKDAAATSAAVAGGNKDAAIAANVLAQQAAAIAVQYTDGQYAAHLALIEAIKRKFTTVLDFNEESYGIYDPTTLSFKKKSLTDIGGFTRASDAIAQHPTRLVTYGANIPRIEYDALTGERLGYFAEEQKANLLFNSQYIGADGENPPTGWVIGFNAGITTTAASPRFEGAARATQSGVSQREFYSQVVSLSAATTYKFSAYFPAVPAATNNVLRVSPSASLTGEISIAASAITAPGRYSITFTTTSAVAISFDVGLGCSGNATGSVTHEMPMLEVSSIAGSYVPTTNGALTRLADRFNIPRPQVSARKGTIFVSFIEKTSNVSVAIAKFNDTANSASRGFVLQKDGTSSLSIRMRDGTTLETISITGVSYASHINAVACFDYELNTIRICVNGVLQSKPIPAGLNNFFEFLSNFIIGGRVVAAGTAADGLLIIRKAWEGPISLTDAEMLALGRL